MSGDATARSCAAGRYWRARWGRWRGDGDGEDGYTLLLPVPGDLPVFLELALAVCATQAHRHRVATLVVPDVVTERVRSAVGARRADWPGPLAMVPIPAPERWVLPRLRSAWRNHAVQVLAGAAAAASSHVVLHDADLFPLDPALHDSQYETARDGELDVLGVSPVWDRWFAERGRQLAATWEMTARVGWLRSFPPYEHVGHEHLVLGELHNCDTTLCPQAGTDPGRVAVSDRRDDFIHFNYVISTYRHFQQRPPGPFDDPSFRLLLVRLLVEMFDSRPEDCDLPELTAMATGLGDPDAPVRHPAPADGGEEYRRWRSQVAGILSGPWAPPGGDLAGQLGAFDRYYGYRDVEAGSAP